MAGPLREPVLALLDAAKNHGDLGMKLSSLNQAKGILLSLEPSLAAELLPYLVELQSSPEGLIRKSLIEVVEEIGLKTIGHSSMLMPFLLASLKDSDPVVARQSIVSGINIFSSVLEELSLQFQRRGIVERWLEELWTWMVRFKDAVFGILLEAGSVGTRLLAMKFLETCVLLFSSDSRDSEKLNTEARSARNFNVSWLVGGHPVLDPVALMSESNRCLGILLDLLQSARSLPGSLTISTVNCLAVIARKRPLYYSSVLSALLDFDPNFESMKGSHKASIQYSLRTAYLGFLRSTYPAIVESRDRLLRALRSMNAGDAADQVIRQVDKMIRNSERASRDAWLNKDDQPSSQLPILGDLMKKRSLSLDNEESTYSPDVASKRICYGPNVNSVPPFQISDSGQNYSVNGVCHKVPLSENDLNPVEQMIAMIGALIAEGERGSESLEILISQIHPDLLADIVIANMKHLPQNTPPLTKLGSLQQVAQQGASSSGPTQVVASNGSTVSVQSPVLTSQIPLFSSNAVSTSLSETSTSINVPESKRDPRRDPRRLDPRRVGATVGVAPTPILDNTNAAQSDNMQSEFDASISSNNPLALPVVTSSENICLPSTPKTEADLKILESSVVSASDISAPKEDVLDGEDKETCPVPEINAALDIALSPVREVDEDSVAPRSSDIPVTDEACNSFMLEVDQLSPSVSNTPVLEDTCSDLPMLPLYVELTEDQQRNVRKLAVERVIESYKHFQGTDCSQTRTALLSRLVAQIDADDDVVVMMQKHIVSNYQHQKGHELVMHVLYHLHTLMISDAVEQSPSAALIYEKFLLGVAKSLLDSLPATDKSFSRLLSEVPFLPNSAMELLDKVCHSDSHCGKDVRDGDRVTQGLGTVWTLILGRPLNRQACLEIALKCAVHSQDDIRTKAIRLVANKLYVLNYISENIEQFATSTFLSAVDQSFSDTELQSGSTEQRTVGEVSNRESQETSISGSQISDPASGNDSVKDGQSDSQSDSPVSFAQAQRLISLFFALCTKKPCLLQTVFDNYARSPKAVKQAVHRHIPILVRALGSSYSELLRIISDPPEGSENLLTQVLHVLFEGTTPSSDLIASVKHIYETKLKDVTILIPVLSSLSKDEVLPIFPRLVNLPLDKFQRALAHILQGSAHTGPALTPAEVLVAIHDINPEKDGLALKKIMDACSACFEQRTVFTQQVLAKALNQMVDQTPLPLLFMRTVIQAIDAFPTLVDFVMEILSKLVSKQVWRMPKLWVGFLKCVSQTQPHSFHVLLQLPSPQLENALNKYASLRGSLAAFANQPNIKATLPRSTLVVLGLVNEAHVHQPHLAPSLHPSDASSSVHGATLT